LLHSRQWTRRCRRSIGCRFNQTRKQLMHLSPLFGLCVLLLVEKMLGNGGWRRALIRCEHKCGAMEAEKFWEAFDNPGRRKTWSYSSM